MQHPLDPLATLAAPALLTYAGLRQLRGRPLPGLRAKFLGEAGAVATGRVLVHGVSLGEVNLMRAVLPALDAAAGAPCLLSCSTATGRARLDELFPERDRCWLPFDLPWAVDRFLAQTRPRAIVLLELELWPRLLLAAAARGIPVLVVNARVSERSYRGYRRRLGLLAPAFRAIHLVLAQNGLWGARLQALGARHVTVTGSLKADMVRPAEAAARDTEARRLGLPAGPADSKSVLLLASSSDGEEAAVMEAWQAAPRAAGWRLVICPRHPERGPAVASLLRQRGLVAVRSSADPLPAPDNAVIVVDEIGRLSALYANAAIAVVGGSLGSGRGGQNMLEAAAAGCATVVGRDTRNFPDAMALLRSAEAIIEAAPAQLTAVLSELCADVSLRARLGSRAQAAWAAGRGSLARCASALRRKLASRP